MILLTTSAMALKNYGELMQLFETFTRVLEAMGDTSLHLHTQDDKARATLDFQLGPPALLLMMCVGRPGCRRKERFSSQILLKWNL